MFSRFFGPRKRPFDSLSEQEILALAVSSEEEDARIYEAYADAMEEAHPVIEDGKKPPAFGSST